ncbi:MAG: DUF1761 domain-containing protein [Cyclobacteriaceae bacterium]
MQLNFGEINWLSIVVCFVVGQVFLTLWFTVFFGEQWAKAYDPTKNKKEHTKEVPGYTYAVGAICMFLLVLGLELFQMMLGVYDMQSGLRLGIFISVFIILATMLPGYAFLKRWNAMRLSLGSQVFVTLIISAILGAW